MRIVRFDPFKYRERKYRHRIRKENLVSFDVRIKETDLWICAGSDLSVLAEKSVIKNRHSIEEYIKIRPEFLSSFSPLEIDLLAPDIVRDMIDASIKAGVGPMAAVAGAIAQYVAQDLMTESQDVIVENGGDIFLRASRDIHVGIFAGESPLSDKITLKIRQGEMPLGVCTSSSSVGHSVSLGCADAVCVISGSAILADAAATAVGNIVQTDSDIRKGLDYGLGIEGVRGVLIIVGEKLGVQGTIELA
jgi:ApbE superfamily uncharacterized protein (UPF0280 family)